MARRPRPKAWMRATERATRDRTPEGAAAAAKVFNKELDRKRQLEVASDIAKTRGAELCRAYANVIDVGAGYRTRRDKTGTPKTRRQVAVVFYVSNKWSDADDERPEDAIPDRLFTYVGIKGRRKLCAVPTDVTDANDEGNAKVQADIRRIRVTPNPPASAGAGTLTCAVRRKFLPNRVFAVSCRHVFSLSEVHHGERFAPWAVSDPSDEALLGVTLNILGTLQDGPEPSLDAQLCEVADPDLLGRVFGQLRFAGVAKGPDDVTEKLAIVTERRRIPVRWFRITHRALPYGHPSLQHVVHRELIATEFNGVGTINGDSGAPLVSGSENPILVGMHIAISEDGKISYAIPATHFLDPRLYKGTAPSETWKLARP